MTHHHWWIFVGHKLFQRYIYIAKLFFTLYTCIWCNAQTSLPSLAFFSEKRNNRIREQEDSVSFSCVTQILDARHVCSAYTQNKEMLYSITTRGQHRPNLYQGSTGLHQLCNPGDVPQHVSATTTRQMSPCPACGHPASCSRG